MANGVYYDNSIFNFDTDWTKRRVTAVTSKTNIISITTVSAMSTVNVGDWIKVENCGTWANGTWKVASKSNLTVNLVCSGLVSGRNFTPTLDSKVFRVTSGGADILENRKLSSMFLYNTDLKATTTMCATQVRVKDILSQFWSNAEVVQEYKVKYRDNNATWPNYGPTGGYGKDKIINAFMCTVYAESTWNPSSINTESDARGLWQITPKEAPWYPTVTNLNLLNNSEYNTRAALWLMWQRLFTYDSGAGCNPFRPWEGSRTTNSKYSSCYSKNPPYGTKTC